MHSSRHSAAARLRDRTAELSIVSIANVYGDAPPDFAAIAACGFGVVCLDSSAPWFGDTTVAEAEAHGLTAVAFRMSYAG